VWPISDGDGDADPGSAGGHDGAARAREARFVTPSYADRRMKVAMGRQTSGPFLTRAGAPGNLRSMAHAHRIMSAPWLVAILVSLLVLGHACELPALADLAMPAIGSSHHHETDHHSDENQIVCDAVGVPNTVYSQVGPGLDPLGAISAATPVSIQLVGTASRGSTRLPSRPPLFLLHASLLI
jgi:hypothetical protein